MNAERTFPLERLRLSKGLSKRRLAQLLEMDPANFGRIESGERRMLWETAVEIAGLCDHVVLIEKVGADELTSDQELVQRLTKILPTLNSDQRAVLEALIALWEGKKA